MPYPNPETPDLRNILGIDNAENLAVPILRHGRIVGYCYQIQQDGYTTDVLIKFSGFSYSIENQEAC